MRADDRLRPLGDRGDPGDRDGRGVGAEHRAVPADPVQLAEELALDLQALEDRLDHEVGPCTQSRSVVVVIRASAASASPARGSPLVTKRSSDFSIAGPAACQRLVGHVAQDTSWPATAATWAMPEPISPARRRPASVVSAMARRLRQRETGRVWPGSRAGSWGPGVALLVVGVLALLLRWGPSRRRSVVERRPRPGTRTSTARWCRSPPRDRHRGRDARRGWPAPGIRAKMVTTTEGPGSWSSPRRPTARAVPRLPPEDGCAVGQRSWYTACGSGSRVTSAPRRPQVLVEAGVAAVDVEHVAHPGDPLRHEPGEHQGGTGPDVAGPTGAAEAGDAVDHRVVPVDAHVGAEPGQLLANTNRASKCSR